MLGVVKPNHVIIFCMTTFCVIGYAECRELQSDSVSSRRVTRPVNRTIIDISTDSCCDDDYDSEDPSMVDLFGKSPKTFSGKEYESVLKLSWLFFDAQRSGRIPKDHPVSWRKSSHMDDVVPGGWYDAGDYLKLNFPLAYSVSMLSWGLDVFESGYRKAGVLESSKESLKIAVTYLMDCHTKSNSYIGQIGHPDIDHDFWGRAQDQKGSRPYFVWTTGMHAADLFGKVSAALASASIVYRRDDTKFSESLLHHAVELYEMAKRSPGLYSTHYKSATSIYPSSGWEDDVAWAATWLYKATSKEFYLDESNKYWSKRYWDVSADWDNSGAATAVLLYQLQAEGATVPDFARVKSFVEKRFIRSWTKSNGFEGIVKTPKGLSRPSWSYWGSMQLSTTSGFLALVCAKSASFTRRARSTASWARSQIDYALGSSGRSFVVGYGKKYPKYPHHAGASCPAPPKACDWSVFESKSPNANILYGALVAGPSGPGDNTYNDRRDDYVTNEVAVDYNAGFTSALAGLVEFIQ
jgi:endoglucanase